MINKRRLILALLIVLIGIIGATAVVGVKRNRARVTSTNMVQQKNNSASNRGSLKDNAKAFGHYGVVRQPATAPRFSDLADLTAHSAVVIVGTPVENHSKLSTDGTDITLNYEVKVEYAYKGNLREGSLVTVSLPGGRIAFPDGTTAEVQTPWLKKMQNGKTYVLFLSLGASTGTFMTTGEAQGVYEIPVTDGPRKVTSNSGVGRDPVWKYNGVDVRSFFRELRVATGKPLRH